MWIIFGFKKANNNYNNISVFTNSLSQNSKRLFENNDVPTLYNYTIFVGGIFLEFRQN